MSLEYYLLCSKNYVDIIQQIEYTIDNLNNIYNLTTINLIELELNFNEIINQNNNNINFFLEKLSHFKSLKQMCDKNVQSLCCHDFIDDTIDSGLDKCINIKYCMKCNYTETL